jgi:septum formation protein
MITEAFPKSLSGQSVVLASSSEVRRRMLEMAGVVITVKPVSIEEAEIRRSMETEGVTAEDATVALAEHKARRAASSLPDGLAGAPVIGSDQILDCNGIWFAKPADKDHAWAQLSVLRGKTHRLISGVCVVGGDAAVWHHVDVAHLRMRMFSDAFLDRYLDAMGDMATETVGGYQIEGLGNQLFDSTEGDLFTILGMPLLPLLDHLRTHAILLR